VSARKKKSRYVCSLFALIVNEDGHFFFVLLIPFFPAFVTFFVDPACLFFCVQKPARFRERRIVH